jgi:hypothetical protein
MVCGVPGSGKSTFGRWLADAHGYRFHEFDAAGCLPGEASSRLPRVVFEFGFLPANLDAAVDLIERGWRPWWFDGDRDAAHASYVARQQRDGHDPVGSELAYRAQMRRIEEAWAAITGVFATRMIRAIEPGPSYMAPADVYARICVGDGVSPPS